MAVTLVVVGFAYLKYLKKFIGKILWSEDEIIGSRKVEKNWIFGHMKPTSGSEERNMDDDDLENEYDDDESKIWRYCKGYDLWTEGGIHFNSLEGAKYRFQFFPLSTPPRQVIRF